MTIRFFRAIMAAGGLSYSTVAEIDPFLVRLNGVSISSVSTYVQRARQLW